VDVALAPVELEHLGRHPVEHVAVVGHHDEAPAEGGEVLLEPADGVEVEVVGRLVEDEEVGLAALGREEGPGQRDPLRLPPRERRHVGIDHPPMPSRSSMASTSQPGVAGPAARP
jgi:hypothetical protein